MKLTLPLSSVRALAIVAVSSRFLRGIFLDMPWLYNAAWLSAVGATLLCATREARWKRWKRIQAAF